MSELARIRGSIPPVISPFRHGKVDYEAYARLLEYQVVEGSHGVLVNGTTAEPSTLTIEERNRLVDIAIETINGRIPVVAATGSQSLAETELLTAHAAKAGADALLIVTPYYIRPPQRGLIEYYLQLAKIHHTPWMIYHIPGRTAINVTLDNDFKIFVGLEELSFPMMTIGACGLMNAVGNLRPGDLAELCEAVWSSDLSRGRDLHQKLLEINQSVFFDTNPIPMKYMMKKLGLMPTNEHRLPMSPATPELEKRLDGVLERAGLIGNGKTA